MPTIDDIYANPDAEDAEGKHPAVRVRRRDPRHGVIECRYVSPRGTEMTLELTGDPQEIIQAMGRYIKTNLAPSHDI